MQQLLRKCIQLTYYQSEDPVWFLLRAFRFTSRTAHGFKAALARDYECLLGGLSWELRGKVIGNRTEPLSEDHTVVREHVRPKWEQVLTTLGMEMSRQPRPSSSESVGQRLLNSSASRISAITKAELILFLSVFGRSVDVRVNKPVVVAAVMQLKADIQSGTISMEGGTEPDIISGDDLTKQAAGRICQAFREASLTAWVMKPLVPTVGTKEGSRNEVELVRALPSFFELRSPSWSSRPQRGTSAGVVLINIFLGPAVPLNCEARTHHRSCREQELRDAR